MKNIIVILVFITSGFANAAICKLPSDVRVIDEDSTAPRLVLAWDMPSTDLATQPDTVDSQSLLYYRVAVLRHFNKNVDPYFLMNRHVQHTTDRKDLFNLKMVLNEKVGQIRPISCLESLLIEFQINRNPQMKAKPTEFLAFILEKKTNMRVYFQTNDALGVSDMTAMSTAIENDQKDGWIVKGTLHNHSFFLGHLAKPKPQGVLAPSATDVQFYLNQDSQFATEYHYITNGFDTLALPRRDLKKLQSAN